MQGRNHAKGKENYHVKEIRMGRMLMMTRMIPTLVGDGELRRNAIQGASQGSLVARQSWVGRATVEKRSKARIRHGIFWRRERHLALGLGLWQT
jgi:hypothetical protein